LRSSVNAREEGGSASEGEVRKEKSESEKEVWVGFVREQRGVEDS
jgi:hypothetical protein